MARNQLSNGLKWLLALREFKYFNYRLQLRRALLLLFLMLFFAIIIKWDTIDINNHKNDMIKNDFIKLLSEV